MMTNGDYEGWVFLSYHHTKDGFFLLTTIFILSNPEVDAISHDDVILT